MCNLTRRFLKISLHDELIVCKHGQDPYTDHFAVAEQVQARASQSSSDSSPAANGQKTPQVQAQPLCAMESQAQAPQEKVRIYDASRYEVGCETGSDAAAPSTAV